MNRPSALLIPPQAQAARSRVRRIVQWVGNWLKWTQPGLFSGLLLWLSFPPVDWSWLAWVALVPLAWLVWTPWGSRPIYRAAWAGGLVFGTLAVQWIRYADDSGLTGYYGWLALAVYLSLYLPLFVLVARVAVLRFRVPAILAVPVCWVGLEYLRSWLITGFPWYYLAHSQYRSIRLIQIADLGGAYGVSFLVALVNGWLMDLLGSPVLRPGPSRLRLAREQVWRLGLVLGVLLASVGYGAVRLKQAEGEPGPRVALIQTKIPQKVKEDDGQLDWIRDQCRELLSEAIAAGPQLIIWPETAYLYGIFKKLPEHNKPLAKRFPLVTISPDVTDEDLRRLFPSQEGEEIDPEMIRLVSRVVRRELVDLAAQAGVPMLMGLNTEYIFRSRIQRYNSAVLVTPLGQISQPYHKVHLVPWGEYLPLSGWLPWLHVLTPHASADYSLDAGGEAVRLPWDKYTLGVLICFEDTVPGAARSYLQTDPVDILVNISNDGWFGGSAELDEHLAISVFRAVECRRPLVRAVNTGISAIIDSSGRLVQVAGAQTGQRKMSSEVVVGEVPLDRRGSFYVRAGDWLGAATFCLTSLILLGGFWTAAMRRLAARTNDANA